MDFAQTIEFEESVKPKLESKEGLLRIKKEKNNTRCRLCRRRADPESMLMCDGCDRGHHLYCLKPKLKKIPSGDWFCHECKPKERVKSPKKKSRRVFEPEPEPEPEAESEEEEEAEDDEEVIVLQLNK